MAYTHKSMWLGIVYIFTYTLCIHTSMYTYVCYIICIYTCTCIIISGIHNTGAYVYMHIIHNNVQVHDEIIHVPGEKCRTLDSCFGLISPHQQSRLTVVGRIWGNSVLIGRKVLKNVLQESTPPNQIGVSVHHAYG